MSFSDVIQSLKQRKHGLIQEARLPLIPEKVRALDWEVDERGCYRCAFKCPNAHALAAFIGEIMEYAADNYAVPMQFRTDVDTVSIVVGPHEGMGSGLESGCAQAISDIFRDLLDIYSQEDSPHGI